ncbi:hypothetical protein HLB23_00755 [Nocardia uniformis]|uniref:Uncharacterized protein n=1 Tax=Nocardia uniformis TaxID=53432 RepID=A0A849BXL0_9NOCA|nr:hypothetical protein [Nocardia uniformis]NNH68427.1 hypothetical protein [Nocardia uniformis]
MAQSIPAAVIIDPCPPNPPPVPPTVRLGRMPCWTPPFIQVIGVDIATEARMSPAVLYQGGGTNAPSSGHQCGPRADSPTPEPNILKTPVGQMISIDTRNRRKE